MNKRKQKGQALVILLFYMIVAITLTTTAVAVVVANSMTVSRSEQGAHAIEYADAGAENAIIRLLRSTGYTGETISIGDGTAIVTVTGATVKTITSIGKIGTFARTIQVVVDTTSGLLTVTSWQEI
jgi:hypothetical protein